MNLEERNKGVVRAGVESFAQRRWKDWRELWHPDAVVIPAPGWPETGRFEGRDAAEAAFKRFLEMFPDWAIENAKIHHAHEEWVIASYSLRGRGGASGAEVNTDLFMAVRVGEDGLVVQSTFHWSFEDAEKSIAGT